VPDSNSKNASPHRFPLWVTVAGVCSFILLLTAGSLVLSSCATTPAGIARENHLYLATSNALVSLNSVAPAIPQPVGGLVEGCLAIGGALMAVWATHLHRSMRTLQNGAKNGTTSPPAGSPSPPAP
jgi:hypothetical protein